MGEQYTPSALAALDEKITKLEADLAAAHKGLGESAESDSNTWHDNAAFDESQRLIRRLEGELAKHRKMRRNAVVVQPKSNGKVQVGSTVDLLDETHNEAMTVFIAGHQVFRRDSSDKSVMEISTSSPLGAAVMGRKAGDTVSYSTPSNKKISIKIVSVT